MSQKSLHRADESFGRAKILQREVNQSESKRLRCAVRLEVSMLLVADLAMIEQLTLRVFCLLMYEEYRSTISYSFIYALHGGMFLPRAPLEIKAIQFLPLFLFL